MYPGFPKKTCLTSAKPMDAAIPMLTSLQKVKPEPDPFDLLHLELPVGIPGVSLMAMAFVQPIISVTSTLHSKKTQCMQIHVIGSLRNHQN